MKNYNINLGKISEAFQQSESHSFSSNKLLLPTLNGFEIISQDEIIYLKSSGNYTEVITINNKKYIISKNIGCIEQKLNYPTFFRIHNEHIVNINSIIQYVNGRGGYIILNNNQHLDVASRRKKQLLAILAY